MDNTTNNWHALTEEEVFAKLETGSNGLTKSEVISRQQTFGFNELKPAKSPNLLVRFLRQFNNVLIYILLASALITVIFQYWVDTSVIIVVVILNALFGCIQEGKAEQALKAIREILAAMAHVWRDGKSQSIEARALVPGDVVFLQTGDKIPADLRLIETNNLQVKEASLTGESLPISKSPRQVAPDTTLAERTSMAYSSTLVTYGHGKGVVVATGTNTEVGLISEELTKEAPIITPLIKKMNVFARWLTVGILVLAATILAVGILVWHDASPNLLMAIVGIMVAAIPEGLPAIMTIILAIGVTRMAKQNAIIRRLPAVETMGSVTTICTDKTGTLTRNELAVQQIITGRHQYEISSNGSSAISAFSLNQERVPLDEHPDLITAVHAALLCNDVILTQKDSGKWYLHGDPLDAALWTLNIKAKVDLDLIKKNFPRTDMIPFASQHKMMATLHHDHTGHGFIFAKGAPEQILNICAWQKKDGHESAIDLDYWHEQVDLMTKRGERVIAIAIRHTTPNHRNLKFHDLKENFTLLGLFGLIDPPRTESKDAVTKCHIAGIKVKMITGDHAHTAANIAKQVGIYNPYDVITGAELEALSQEEIKKVANEINVYARTSPQDKLRLVEALKETDNIVAMTGDGVNDAPALMQADIGIAMGRKGTEAAKEAAAMVLTDDNFATITSAIEAGRTIYSNLKKAILYVLPTSFAQSLAIIIAVLFGKTLPITPVQILWVNMVTTITLSLAFAFEPTEAAVMARPPRPVHEPILSGLLAWRTAFVSVLITAAAFALFLWERTLTHDNLELTRTIVVNMVVAGEVVYLFNCRKIYSSSWNIKTLLGSKPALFACGLVFFLQMAFTYLPFMQQFFDTAPVKLNQWLNIILCALIIFFCVEAEKYLIRRRKSWHKHKQV